MNNSDPGGPTCQAVPGTGCQTQQTATNNPLAIQTYTARSRAGETRDATHRRIFVRAKIE